MSDAILERIHQVIGNLVRICNITRTYAEKGDPWSVILSAAAFEVRSTKNRLKYYSPGQLVFGCGIIIPIEHTVNWEIIRQRKQTQINKDNIYDIETKLTTNIM